MAERTQPWAEVLAFWFDEAGPRKWYAKDAAFDATIRARFAALHERAGAGELSAWEQQREGALALVILLDQFPRNMFRDSPQAFASDPPARAVADRAVARGYDLATPPERRAFFYLPFMHSESLADQERSVALYDALARAQGKPIDPESWARRHHRIVARFGRFPHRNAVLGRASTEAEVAFLAEAGSSF